MHELHQPRRNEEKCHSFKTLLPLLFLLCGKPQHGGGQRQSGDWISASSQPSSYTYPLHHSSIKNPPLQSSLQYIVSKKPHSADQMSSSIPLSALQQQSPANEKCLCNHTSPRSCASSTCTHLLFFSFALPFSLPNCN